MNTDNKTIRKFRIRMAALLILKNILAFATVWGLIWGTVVIVLRAVIGMPPVVLIDRCYRSDSCHRLCSCISVASNSDTNRSPSESGQTRWCRWVGDGSRNRRTGQLAKTDALNSPTPFALARWCLLDPFCRCHTICVSISLLDTATFCGDL